MNRSKPTAHRAHEMSGEILMVDRKQAAAIAAVSIATWDRMNAGGKTPEPIHLSRGCVRWRLDDLRLWVALGCPDRKSFSQLKQDEIS